MTSTGSAMIRPVILCGGAGTRLWPLSRQAFPKQFLTLIGEGSLLQQTAARLSGEHFLRPIVVGSEGQRNLIESQLGTSGTAIEAVLLEPTGRNTAAAATFAAEWLIRRGNDELMLLMPSDHVIGDPEAFIRAIEIGIPHADHGAIVTFGARPTSPSSQYGYIEAETNRPLSDSVFAIARFHEKPDRAEAVEYVQSGRFFWNAGIFLARASTILAEMRQFLAGSLEAISEAVSGASSEKLFVRPEAEIFERAESISIDKGIMEKTARGVVVPVQMDWSDVGSWEAVWNVGERDDAGNMVKGEVIALDTTNSLLRSEDGILIAALGVEKMAVIAVRDAVLIAPLERTAELKKIVERLKDQNR